MYICVTHSLRCICFPSCGQTVDSSGVGDTGCDPHDMATKIAKFLQEHAPKSAPALGEIVGIVSRRVQSPLAAPQQSPSQDQLRSLNSGDPRVFVRFFGGAPHFALFRDDPRPLHAANFYCPAKQGDWMWISHQARENLSGPESAN